MNFLFVHQNFPGQYTHLARVVAADPANQVVAMSMNTQPPIPGVRAVISTEAKANTPGLHPWLVETETKFLRGHVTLNSALALKKTGFSPDVICAHPGWGEALFLKDVWPNAAMICLFEFYYHFSGADVGYDTEFLNAPDIAYRLRMKNINNLLSLSACDMGVSPTEWQKKVQPPEFHHKIRVIHDGIDTDAIRPNHAVSVIINESIVLTPADEVVTFVSRNLEPYRGFHTFMRAVPSILKRRPKARILIIGDDGVSYGSPPKGWKSFRQQYLAEIGTDFDRTRVHFLGRVPRKIFQEILQISSAHVYLTYPFVLSWSMLEAMAAGCLVIGSRTPPVEEVITHAENGLLVDFFSPGEIADAVDAVLDDPHRMRSIRVNARQMVIERYDLARVCLPRHMAMINELAGR